MYSGEKFNSISHLAGTVLAIAGTAVLVIQAARAGGATAIVGASIYGPTLILL